MRPAIIRYSGDRPLRTIAIRAAVALTAIALCLVGARSLARARSVQLFGALIHRVDTPERRVALTFDDGPHPSMLDSILATLSARGVSATFFLVGNAIEEHPGAAERLVAAGHELGNHTYSHQRMVLRTPAFVKREVERTDSLIRATGQGEPIYFRPPYSYKLAVLPWYLWRTRRTTVTCDVEPESYPEVARSADAMIRHVLDRVKPGSIILLHPWYETRAPTREALGPLIDSLHARAYSVGTVRQLIRSRTVTRRGP